MEPQDVLKTVRSLAHLDLSRMDEGTREQVASVLTFALGFMVMMTLDVALG